MSLQEARSEYTVLARRFRPQAFDEVVGQEHVAQALRNAIASGRVAHAYLFTGARGVGKTSTARILAKSLNCPNAVNGDPCNQCEICQGISTGSDVDVLEIDGASNRGIDDIRSLRANVNVRSMRSRYKIYIIDEVHMLTKEAFNALLKTLEEPPPNVKFIFCTTEPNKLPDTILSRCQRFDFGTIETGSIIGRLSQIAEAEGRIVEQSALELVARRAAGSMRDSQSLFDQLLAYGGEQITADDVHRLLGTAPDERLIELVAAIIERRRGDALEKLQAALDSGVQLGELTDQLLQYLRDLLVQAAGAQTVALLSVADEHRPALAQQASTWGLKTIAAAMQILAETKARMQRVNYGRALAELAIVRLSLLEDLDNLDQLVDALRGGGPVPGPASRPGPAPLPGSPKPAAIAPRPATEAAKSPARPNPPRAESDGDLAAAASAPVPEPSVEGEPEVPHVEFVPGNESKFWTEVLAQIPGMLRDNAKRGQPSAISGPNQLVISFPKSYDLNRTYCERVDNSSRLEKIATAVARRPVRIVLKSVDTPVANEEMIAVTPAASRKIEVPRKAEAIRDPLVQKALAEFGGTVVKIENIGNASA
jgi:DNA polymerase-3 subunit gamma/tau